MNNSAQILIRQGTAQDADLIAEFNQKIAMETEGMTLADEVIKDGVLQVIENPDKGFYLVAEQQGEIIGSLMITTEWSDWRNGVFWWVQSVYVVQHRRRTGIYNLLYSRVKELGKQAGNVCGYRLYVEKENSGAQKAYQELGMVETHYRMYEELAD